ncbi:MAG: aminotransferase class III-fold pyridoxal phosphate-dependent enzyme [SAR324 cluster bacterium]|nr:aminotransferase class III-fold pyridoxal phosphate-dependent enzyme [SAR324 cluster bacterium]
MNKKITKEQIVKWDKDHNIHPYMNFSDSRKIIIKGEGAYVYDQDGQKFLDGIGGLWCVNIGHGRSELGLAYQEQVEELGYFSTFSIFSNRPSSILAKKLVDLTYDKLQHVYFTNGGSEANDATVRIINNYNHLRKMPHKRHIITRKMAYHGMTYLTASISGIDDNNKNYQNTPDFIHYLSTPNCYRRPKEDMSDADYVDYLGDEYEAKITELGADNVAVFFAEPIMGAGGIYVAPNGYHKRMWEICEKNDIFYVSDEVVTGFCRLGEFFTTNNIYGIKPDFINVAKGITSGYAPLGAIIFSDKVFDVIKKGEFTSAFTYSGHPACTAVANKNIEIMEKEFLCEYVKSISTHLWKELRSLQGRSPYLGDVRGSHFMIGLEFVKRKDDKLAFGNKIKFSTLVANQALKNGLIIRPLSDEIMVISPTLIWQKEDIDKFINILETSINFVAEGI